MPDQKETVQEKDVTRKSGTDTDRSSFLYMPFWIRMAGGSVNKIKR